MGDYWVQMALSVLFSVLQVVVKNPARQKELARAMIKLRKSLEAAYPPEMDEQLLNP